jgi:hypothetical protein
MKKNFYLFFLILITISSFGQKIEENKIDEFTKTSIKRTSWETLNMTMSYTAYFRISLIENIEYFDLKLMIPYKSVSISEGQNIMFMLENNEILTLKNLKTAYSCTGCGARGFSGSAAPGVSISYLINTDQIKLLKANKIKKIRIYTNDGYIENELKDKFDNFIKNSLLIIE